MEEKLLNSTFKVNWVGDPVRVNVELKGLVQQNDKTPTGTPWIVLSNRYIINGERCQNSYIVDVSCLKGGAVRLRHDKDITV